jgi:ABC-type nitrate/sulfonate/bicarbonate transport system substrate-binding protein
MLMRALRRWLSAVVVCGLVAAGGTMRSSAQEPVLVRAGKITADMSVLPVVLGQQRGHYQRAGLNLRFVDFGSGTDAIRAVVSGDIDVFLTTMFSTLSLLKARGPVDVWATFQLSDHPIFLFVVKADSRVRAIADLRGRKVGITRFGSGSDFLARAMLVKYGLRADEDVTLVQTGSIPAGIAGVERGELDAAVAWHPLAAEGAMRGSLRVLATARDDAPGLEPTTPAFRGPFLAQNAPAARRFIQATLASLRQIRADPAAAAREAAALHQIPEPIARATVDFYLDVWTRDGQFNEKGLIDTQLWLIRIQQMERIVPLATLIRKDLLP